VSHDTINTVTKNYEPYTGITFSVIYAPTGLFAPGRLFELFDRIEAGKYWQAREPGSQGR
jgi:hypothetical protein